MSEQYPVALQMYIDLKTMPEIAAYMGTSVKSASVRITKMRYKYSVDKRMTDCSNPKIVEFIKDKDLALELYNSGIAMAEIARKWEIASCVCRQILIKWGAEMRGKNRVSIHHLPKVFEDVKDGVIITHEGEDIFKLVKL